VTTLPLDTLRLRIAPLTIDDAASLCRLVTTPDIGRMLFIFPPDFSEADAGALIARQSNPLSRPLRLGLKLRGNPDLIGTIGVGSGDAPDIYYFLDPAFSGRGLMREALAAFVPFVQAQFGLTSLGAKVFTDNPASAHLLEGAGFAVAGTSEVQSAQRVAPAPVWIYRLERAALRSA